MTLSNEQKERYARQLISPEIGEEGQEKLMKSKVLQIGAGGLGSPFSMYLVAAGIGELTIIDDDIVDLSNLQRQILFCKNCIGRVKVEAAKDKLALINPDTDIIVKKMLVDDKALDNLIKGKDYIVDCSDNAKTKFMVNDAAIRNNVRCTIAGVKDFYGQILTINPKKTACYRCVFYDEPEKPSKDEGPIPVLGVTPGILGTLEAVEVIKSLLNIGETLENNLLMVNLLNMSFTKIPVQRYENCMCSK